MKIIKHSALFLSFALALASCGGNSGTEAETGEAQEVVEVAEASSFSINPANSQVIWNGRKPAGEHHGTIAVQDGAIQLKDNKVVGGTIQMDLTQIDVTDLEGEDEQKLAGHLQSADFFNVEQYPTAKFVITSVEDYNGGNTGDSSAMATAPEDTENNGEYDNYQLENPTHKVTGNLTLRDTTLSITIPASIQVQDEQVTAKSRFTIDRSKWKVNYMDESNLEAKAKDKFIYNKVNVGFDVVASKQ
jgi:polyisoprenoid-binding protein YceI